MPKPILHTSVAARKTYATPLPLTKQLAIAAAHHNAPTTICVCQRRKMPEPTCAMPSITSIAAVDDCAWKLPLYATGKAKTNIPQPTAIQIACRPRLFSVLGLLRIRLRAIVIVSSTEKIIVTGHASHRPPACGRKFDHATATKYAMPHNRKFQPQYSVDLRPACIIDSISTMRSVSS